MLRASATFSILFILWILLSGHTEPLLLFLGVASCVLTFTLAYRMEVFHPHSHTLQLSAQLPHYLPWLFWQIVLSNIAVARIILRPRISPKPQAMWIPATQKTTSGIALHANSITLTPGTLSVEVKKGEILVHSVSEEIAKDIEAGEIDRRVSDLEVRAKC